MNGGMGGFTQPDLLNVIVPYESNILTGEMGAMNSAAFVSINRSVQYDPFLRTRNIPYKIAGRRRSISFFSTIDEADETIETA